MSTDTARNKKLLISVRNMGINFMRKKSMFRREPFQALKNVSFDLYHGDSLGVIGRNGAGKTTLLRLLGGITVPDSGTITNYGYSTALLSLQVGFDPQLTGRSNAILSGMFLGFRKKEVEEIMDKIIDFSELGQFIDQPVRTYSSGMMARLGFSVAIHLDPDVLLVDEVLAVGDIDFQKKSSKLMHEKLCSDKTIVLVSHQAEMLRQLCNRAVWIEGGITMAEGDTAEVIEEYELFLQKYDAQGGSSR